MLNEFSSQPIRAEQTASKSMLLKELLTNNKQLLLFRQLSHSELSTLTQSNTQPTELLLVIWSQRNHTWKLLPKDDSGTLVMVDGNNLLMKNGAEYIIGITIEVLVKKLSV